MSAGIEIYMNCHKNSYELSQSYERWHRDMNCPMPPAH